MGALNVLIRFFKRLKNHIHFAVVLIVLLLLTVWLVFAFIIDPEYQASSQLLIAETETVIKNPTLENERLDLQSIEAYAFFIESPEILAQVRADMKLGLSISDLQKKIVIDYSNDSPVLTVTAFSDSSQQSVQIANTLSSIFQNEVKKSLETADISIISQAAGSEKASTDSGTLILSILAAAVFGFIFNILTAYISKSVKAAAETRKDVRKKENQLQTVFK